MSKEYIQLDYKAKRVLNSMLPSGWSGLVKSTPLGGFYDTEYKIDGMMKTPYTCDHIFLYDVKTNKTHQDSMTFTIKDQNLVSWKDKSKADLYIFVFQEKRIAFFLSLSRLEKLLDGLCPMKSRKNPSEFVWLSLGQIERHSLLILQDSKFSLPGGESSEDSIRMIWNTLSVEIHNERNQIKNLDLDNIFKSLVPISSL